VRSHEIHCSVFEQKTSMCFGMNRQCLVGIANGSHVCDVISSLIYRILLFVLRCVATFSKVVRILPFCLLAVTASDVRPSVVSCFSELLPCGPRFLTKPMLST